MAQPSPSESSEFVPEVDEEAGEGTFKWDPAQGKLVLASPSSSGAFNLAPPLSRLKKKTDWRPRCTMVASTTPAAGGRRPSGGAQTLGQTHKPCASGSAAS